MDFLPLDSTELRIVATLIEKSLTTPEHYPLTLNALQSGCNQKSNREPVLHLAEFELEGALRSLEIKRLVARVTVAGGRTIRFRERLGEELGLKGAPLAVLTELMLRGSQQPGALRTRSSRMASVPDLAALEGALATLEAHHPPLVRNLGRMDGERAVRWTHALGGESAVDEGKPVAAEPVNRNPELESSSFAPDPAPLPATREPEGWETRQAALEARVQALESSLLAIQREIGIDPPQELPEDPSA